VATWFAALVVGIHLAFVAFVMAGGLLAFRWPRIIWLHLPAVVWAVWVEWSGGVCPLTPLEHALRARAGLAPYEGDFIARWVFPLLYPEGLTREMQVTLGLVALATNVGLYGWLVVRRRHARSRMV
jgi:hypothetical protein